MKKWTVITGGAGFIGSNLAERLASTGLRVRIVDNLERGHESFLAPIRDKIDFVHCDLRDGKAAIKALLNADTVYHLAAQVGGIRIYEERPGSLLHANLLIDQNVIAAALAAGTQRFIYASSAHVYPIHRQITADAPPLKEDEAMPADPALTYGWGKRIGEITLQGLANERSDFHVALPRIMGAYGCNQDITIATGSVIPVFCHRAAIWPKGAPFRILGTGKETRSYVFIDDVIDALIRAAEKLSTTPLLGPFNLAAEGRVTIRYIAETIVRISGKSIPLEFDTGRKTSVWGQAADTTLAANLLDGWKARTPFEVGLRRVYNHVLKRVLKGNE